jgi:hypothetical protein
MSNTQFYIGIAIPSVLILLGWLHQNVRLTDLRGDFNDMRGGMTQLRVDINKDMTQLRVDINHDLVTLRDSIHRDMVPLHGRMATVEAKQR